MQDVLDQLGGDQTLQNGIGVDARGFPLELLLDPAPLVRIRYVHEFRAAGSTVETASERTLVSEHVMVGNRRGCETSKRIERRLEISPATERVENLFARAIALFS